MIDSSKDVHVESSQLQAAIEEYLGIKESRLIFEYSGVEGKVKLDLITVNPRHNQSFLFRSEIGYDKLDVLKKMLDYVKSNKEKESSYTIQWMTRDDHEVNTSYVRAKSIYDALDKLYYGRDMNTKTVFSVVLNPVS